MYMYAFRAIGRTQAQTFKCHPISEPTLPQQKSYMRMFTTAQGNKPPSMSTSNAPFVGYKVHPDFVGSGNEVIRLCKSGQLTEALPLFYNNPDASGASFILKSASTTQQYDIAFYFSIYNKLLAKSPPNVSVFIGMLRACQRLGEYGHALTLWNDMNKYGMLPDQVCFGLFTAISTKAASANLAHQLFDKLTGSEYLQKIVNEIDCTQLIQAFAKNNCFADALKVLQFMKKRSLLSCVAYMCSTRGCSDLSIAKQIHDHLRQSGLKPNVQLETGLINMYANCGSIEDAHSVFKTMPMQTRDTIAWNSMLAAFVQCAQPVQALRLFEEMKLARVKPTAPSYMSALSACAQDRNLEIGKSVHNSIRNSGIMFDLRIQTALIHMYGKCNSLQDADKVFASISSKDNIVWNAMIQAYLNCGQLKQANDLLSEMQGVGINPDKATFILLLSACTHPSALLTGKQIYNKASTLYKNDTQVLTAVLGMYSRCGNSIEQVQSVFNEIKHPDPIAWNALMSAYINHKLFQQALDVFHQIQDQNVCLTDISYFSALTTCVNLQKLELGKQLYAQAVQHGFGFSGNISGCMVSLLAQSGDLSAAHKFFSQISNPPVPVWNALIVSYCSHQKYAEGLKLFQDMKKAGHIPNVATYCAVLSICTELKDWEGGTKIYNDAISLGFASSPDLLSIAIPFFGKSGQVDWAESMFYAFPTMDVFVWNSLIKMYQEQKLLKKALEVYSLMKEQKVIPDEVTYSTILAVCTDLGEWHKGMSVYQDARKSSFADSIYVAVATMTLYSCASFYGKAKEIFEGLPKHTVATYNAWIAVCGRHGHDNEAIAAFQQMLDKKIQPDDITFVSLLSAYSHTDMVTEALECYNTMEAKFCVKPNIHHANCIIDALGRSQRLREAEEFVATITPDAVTWMTLLSAYRTQRNIDGAKKAAKRALELDPDNGSVYVILRQIHDDLGQTKEAQEIIAHMEKDLTFKKPGATTLHLDGVEHRFVV